MTSVQTRRIIVALLAAFGLAACSGASRGVVRTQPSPSAQPASGARIDTTYIAKARADSARHPYTEADINFMSGMIGHHAQAIVMARWAPTHVASSAVRTLHERIINELLDEIEMMQGW